MEIKFQKYTLELKHQFNISFSSRKTTPAVIVKLIQDGIEGYGEASLPPYLKENQESVTSFLEQLVYPDLTRYENIIEINRSMEREFPGNTAAKAAVDIAMHDLLGNLWERPCYEYLGISTKDPLFTSYTIGIDKPEIIEHKINEACDFKILKIKLGTADDYRIINTVRELTDKRLYVDANQGWADKYAALELTHFLKEHSVELIEQPFPVSRIEDTSWLNERSPLPIIADESMQTFNDIETVKNCFAGINIKLMKCSGIANALEIIGKAREYNLKIMIGCMTETSCAISAAMLLSPLADYADLDGNLLIKNDPFVAETVRNGQLYFSGNNGLGIKINNKFNLQI